MRKSIKITCIISAFITLIAAFLYLIYLYIIPPIINSVRFNKQVENVIYEKTGIKLYTNKLKFKTHYNLKASLIIDKIYLENENKRILDGNYIDIEFSPLKRELNKINIDYIYIDKNGISKIFISDKEKKKKNPSFSSLPEINIKKIEVEIFDEGKKTFLLIENAYKNNNQSGFNAIINSDYLKNPIVINNKNNISFNGNKIEIENLNIEMGDSVLKLSGERTSSSHEYILTGNNLPVSDIESSILYVLKLKKPQKNFLENFYDFSGTADLNLKFKDSEIYGLCKFTGLGAKTQKFDIPIKLNKFTAYFDGREINAEATGFLGPEKVYTNFKMIDFNPEKRIIKGMVRANLTNKIVKEYIPYIKIDGSIQASMSYYIRNKLPQITYLLKINEGSNLYYKNASLDLTEKNRRLYVRTRKEGDKLYINSYNYSTQEGTDIKKILSGEGLFVKENGKTVPDFLSCKTNDEAPVSVIGSFGEKLNGGTFKGDLKYDFKLRLLTGNFALFNSKYKDFYVKEAKISADENIFEIKANGTYIKSPFEADINMKNKFYDTITVNNIYLFLDNYTIANEYKKHKPIKNSKLKKHAEDLDFIVNNGHIKINKVQRNRIKVENIELIGSLKKDTVNFTIPQARFAKGILTAKGKYNIAAHSSDVDFSAQNIDSNNAADMIFHLPGQIEGIANARLKAVTKDNLKQVKAKGSFSVKGGYLPQLGSTQFIIKRSNKNKKPIKIRISDIINIDISKSKALSSDLNGSFDITNDKLSNVKIFSKQKYLSLFIEGDYDINKEYAKLQIWGNYNKNAQKKVKILFVPLSFIMKMIFKQENTKYLYMNKIKQIPPINANEEETETFTVKIKGNLNNSNNIKVELKSLI